MPSQVRLTAVPGTVSSLFAFGQRYSSALDQYLKERAKLISTKDYKEINQHVDFKWLQTEGKKGVEKKIAKWKKSQLNRFNKNNNKQPGHKAEDSTSQFNGTGAQLSLSVSDTTVVLLFEVVDPQADAKTQKPAPNVFATRGAPEPDVARPSPSERKRSNSTSYQPHVDTSAQGNYGLSSLICHVRALSFSAAYIPPPPIDLQFRLVVPQQKNTLLAEVFVNHFHLAFVPDVKDSSTIKEFTRSLRSAYGPRPSKGKASAESGATPRGSMNGGAPEDDASVHEGARVLNGVHVGYMRLIIKGSMPLARPVGAAALKGPSPNDPLYTDYNLSASLLSQGPEITLDPSIVRHLLDLQTIGDMFSFRSEVSAFDAGVFSAPGSLARSNTPKPEAPEAVERDKEGDVTNISLRLVTLIRPGSIALHRLSQSADANRQPPPTVDGGHSHTNIAAGHGSHDPLRPSQRSPASSTPTPRQRSPSPIQQRSPRKASAKDALKGSSKAPQLKVVLTPESAMRSLNVSASDSPLFAPGRKPPLVKSPIVQAMDQSSSELDANHLTLDVGKTSLLFPDLSPGRPDESQMDATFVTEADESMSMHFDSAWTSADAAEANAKLTAKGADRGRFSPSPSPIPRRSRRHTHPSTPLGITTRIDEGEEARDSYNSRRDSDASVDEEENDINTADDGETLLAKIPLPAVSCTYTFDSTSGQQAVAPTTQPTEGPPAKMHVAVVSIALAPVTLKPTVLAFVEEVRMELAAVSFGLSGSSEPVPGVATAEPPMEEGASYTMTVRVEPTAVRLTCKPSRVVCELAVSRPIDAVITWGPPTLPKMSLQCANISVPLVTLGVGQAGGGDLMSFVLQHAHMQLGRVAGTDANATPLTTVLVTLSFVTVRINAALLSQGTVVQREWLDRLKVNCHPPEATDTKSTPTPAKEPSSNAPSRSGLLSVGVIKLELDMSEIAKVHTSLELRVKNIMARAFDSGSAQPEDQRTLKYSAESKGVSIKPRGHEMVLESLGGKGLRSDGFKISFQRTPLPLFFSHDRPRRTSREEHTKHGRKCALHCNRWKFQLLPLKLNLSTRQTELLEIESRGLTIIASDRYKHGGGVDSGGGEAGQGMDEWRWSVMLDVSLEHLHVHVMSSQAIPYLIRLGAAIAAFVIKHLVPASDVAPSPSRQGLSVLIAEDRRALLEDTRKELVSWVHALAQGELRIKGRRLKLKFFAEAHTKDALLVTMVNYKLALSSALTGQSRPGEPVDPGRLKLARRLVFDIGGHRKVSEEGTRAWVPAEAPKDKRDPTGINIYRAYYGTKSAFSPIFQIPTFVLEMKTVESAAPIIASQFETTWDDHITVAPDLSYRFLRDIVDRYVSEFDDAEDEVAAAMPAKRIRKAARKTAALVAAAAAVAGKSGAGVNAQDLQLSVHNFDRVDDDDSGDEDSEAAGSDKEEARAPIGKRIETDRTRFELGDPQLNVLNKLGAGMSVEGLLKLLGVVDEDTPLESVIPQGVHSKLTLQVEALLKEAHALSLAVDAACY